MMVVRRAAIAAQALRDALRCVIERRVGVGGPPSLANRRPRPACRLISQVKNFALG
jgi:hypothetical protein